MKSKVDVMSKYDSWTDDEIDLAVTKIVYADELEKQLISEDVLEFFNCSNKVEFYKKHYCKRWADMGPLIYNNGISLIFVGGVEDTWKARSVHTETVHNTNPLRAAAEVYLIIKEY
jgi:hypothetical protein